MIVDAFGSPTIQADLQKFDKDYGLPDPPSLKILQPVGAPPAFDPNKPAAAPSDARRNRLICDIYEPGSTFKTFVAAMSLEKKLWRRNEMILRSRAARRP